MPEYIFESPGEEVVLFSSERNAEVWENILFAQDGETVYVSREEWQVIAQLTIKGLQITHLDANEKVVDVVTFMQRQDKHTFPIAGGVVAQLADH